MGLLSILMNVPHAATSMSRSVIAAAAGALVLLFGLVIALRPAPVQVDLTTVTHGPIRVTVDEVVSILESKAAEEPEAAHAAKRAYVA